MSLEWSKVDEALFATAISGRNGARYQLIAEQLPDTDGWDWSVWRLGDAPATARHGMHLLPKPRSKRPRLRPSIGTTLAHLARLPIPDPGKVSGGSLSSPPAVSSMKFGVGSRHGRAVAGDTVKQMSRPCETRRAFSVCTSDWEIPRHDKFSRGREQIWRCGAECWRANLRD